MRLNRNGIMCFSLILLLLSGCSSRSLVKTEEASQPIVKGGQVQSSGARQIGEVASEDFAATSTPIPPTPTTTPISTKTSTPTATIPPSATSTTTRPPTSTTIPTATSSPFPSLTPEPVVLPLRAESTGWLFLIESVSTHESIQDGGEIIATLNEVFLVLEGRLINNTNEFGCLRGSDWIATDAPGTSYGVNYEAMEAVKATYQRDYPGRFLGICVNGQGSENTYVIFDVPMTVRTLIFRGNDGGRPVTFSSVGTLAHAVTATATNTSSAVPSSTASNTPTPSHTATPTFTPLPETATSIAAATEIATNATATASAIAAQRREALESVRNQRTPDDVRVSQQIYNDSLSYDVYGWYVESCTTPLCTQDGYLVAFKYFNDLTMWLEVPIWYVPTNMAQVYTVNGNSKNYTPSLLNAVSEGIVTDTFAVFDLFENKPRN